MAQVKLELSTLTNEEVIALAETIITSMTGNANFATPNPTLVDLTAARTTAQQR